jgi:hypothetical protein
MHDWVGSVLVGFVMLMSLIVFVAILLDIAERKKNKAEVAAGQGRYDLYAVLTADGESGEDAEQAV